MLLGSRDVGLADRALLVTEVARPTDLVAVVDSLMAVGTDAHAVVQSRLVTALAEHSASDGQVLAIVVTAQRERLAAVPKSVVLVTGPAPCVNKPRGENLGTTRAEALLRRRGHEKGVSHAHELGRCRRRRRLRLSGRARESRP